MSTTSFITTQISRTLAIPTREKLRFLVVAGVILGSFLIGYKARPIQLNYILLGFVSLGAAFIFIRRPVIGILSILLTGIFVSYSGPGGVNVTVILVMVLPLLWLLDMVALRGEFNPISSRAMLPVYALIILSTLAFAMGQIPLFMYVDSAPVDAQLGGYAIYVLSFVAFFITANQVRELEKLRKLTWYFLLFACLYMMAIAIPAIRLYITGWFGTSGSLFWLWFIALAYAMALFNHDLSFRWRALLLAIVGLAIFILFALKFDNKSGWVPAFFILWVITSLRSWKVGGLMLATGLIAGFYLYGEIYGTEGYSLSTRLELLPIMWQIFSANPLFGSGFGNYHFYSQLFAIRGWYVTLNSHNNYVDIFVQTGMVGALAFAWFVWEMGVLLVRLRGRVKDGFSKAYVNAAIGGFAGMLAVGMLGDWFLPFVYNIGLSGFRASVMGWVFLGGVLVIEKHYSPTES